MLDVALDTTDQHDAFRQALTDHGIRCALELLNDRTSYRFTAIYKLVGSVLRAQYAYDRTCEYRTWLMVVPLERSFCQYAIESGEFMTSSVSEDPRLANRPYAGMVEAYYGQLLLRPDGTPYGTFIHFDLESRSIAATGPTHGSGPRSRGPPTCGPVWVRGDRRARQGHGYSASIRMLVGHELARGLELGAVAEGLHQVVGEGHDVRGGEQGRLGLQPGVAAVACRSWRSPRLDAVAS